MPDEAKTRSTSSEPRARGGDAAWRIAPAHAAKRESPFPIAACPTCNDDSVTYVIHDRREGGTEAGFGTSDAGRNV